MEPKVGDEVLSHRHVYTLKALVVMLALDSMDADMGRKESQAALPPPSFLFLRFRQVININQTPLP